MSGASSTFAGLRIQDREGKKLATVAVEVSRRGVRLEGKKGTLGNFPFQSIGSWTRASARSLGLVVAANNAQREVILHADDPKLVDAVLTAIDATVQAILHEMSGTPGGSAAMSTENPEATYATPDASSGSEGDGEGAGASSSSPAEVSSTGGGGGGDGSQMTRTESVAKMRAAAADKKRREAENRAVLAERDLAAAEKEVAELRARLAQGGGDGGGTLASDLKVAQLEEELRNVSAQLDRAIERQDAVSERERLVSAREQAVAEAELEEVRRARSLGVYCLDGGAFSFSVLKRREGHSGIDTWELLAARRSSAFGSDQIDELVVSHLVERFEEQEKIDLSKDHLALQRLHDAAESVKSELCSALDASVSLPFITADQNGPKHLEMRLSRSKFSSLIEPLVSETLPLAEEALSESSVCASDLDAVLLLGGSARTESVVALVSERLGRPVVRMARPEEAVALGAAMHARRLQAEQFA